MAVNRDSSDRGNSPRLKNDLARTHAASDPSVIDVDASAPPVNAPNKSPPTAAMSGAGSPITAKTDAVAINSRRIFAPAARMSCWMARQSPVANSSAN